MKENQNRIQWILILKWGLVLLCAFVIISGAFTNRTSSTSFQDMRKQVVKAADLTNMKKADDQMIRRLYGFDPDSFDGIVLYYPKSNMNAEELLLVKLKNEDQRDQMEKTISNRVATQKKSFKGYGAKQTAMLEKSIVEVRGNYALYISAKNPEKVKAAFDAAY
ncbi:MAG: DUF4358 domain-containing protein [Eubacteriales bacterium]|nr:DUF4358 domain-containing protein [Eubacteriales bacterium]